MFSMVASALIFLIAVLITLILFFGRKRHMLEADLENTDGSDSIELDNSVDSSVSAENLLRNMNPPHTFFFSWLKLKTVFTFTALVHVIALCWAFIGILWYFMFPMAKCDKAVEQVSTSVKLSSSDGIVPNFDACFYVQVAFSSEFYILFVFFMDLASFYLFKVESCFPSKLDSKPFHSPFVERGMKLFKAKIANVKRAVTSSQYLTKKHNYVNVPS